MSITIANGITIGAGIALGAGSPSITLKLNLDAAGYTSGPWIDTVANRSFTLYGGVTYSADGGGSLVFDPASSQYAECTSSLSNLNTWTVVAWHYYSDTNTGVAPCIITEKYPNTTTNINYSLGNDATNLGNDRLVAGYFDGAWSNTNYEILPAVGWYQLVGTFDGTDLKMYINNTLVSTVNAPGTPISGQDGIRLMRRWDNTDYWGGKLAIVQVYEGAMDSIQVNSNYNTNIGRFSTAGVDNVVGYSQMNPPVVPGSQLEDSSATINGSTGFTINDDGSTGIAIPGLTASNVNWFIANYPTVPGTYTCTWGPGSTVASSSINVVQVPSSWPGGDLVFFVQGQTGAATYNYPFTFGV